MSIFSKARFRLSTHLAMRHGPKQSVEKWSRPPAPRLPFDVLELIFYELKKTSIEAFVRAMGVCREWRDAGETLLWTHAVLRPSHIDAFVSTVKPRYAEYLHSLTISFKNFYSIVRSEDLCLLPRALESLPQLEVFSIRISNVRFDYRVNRDLENIVKALPPSTRSLQIEFGAAVSKHKYGTSCHSFTEALRKVLPQLQNLRIFGKICCQHLFEPFHTPCPQLQSVVLDCFMNHVPVATCGDPVDYLDDHLIIQAQQLVRSGIVPSLQTFTIVQRHRDKRYYVRPARIADLLHNSSIPVPVLVKRILQKETSVFPALFDGQDHTVCVRLSIEGPSRNLWGNKFDIASAIEGEDAWYHTATGSSFPRSYHRSESGRSGRLMQIQQPQKTRLEIRKNTFDEHGFMRPWYTVEDRMGATLVYPTTYEGLGNDPSIRPMSDYKIPDGLHDNAPSILPERE